MTEYYVEIKDYEMHGTVRRIGPYPSGRRAEKIERSANINLDHENFYTAIVEEETEESNNADE